MGLFTAGFLSRPLVEAQPHDESDSNKTPQKSSSLTNASSRLSASPAHSSRGESPLALQTELEQNRRLSGPRTFAELEQETSLLLRLAQSDPQLAVELANQEGSKVSEETRLELLTIWAGANPKDAWQWSLDNDVEEPSEVLTAIAKDDPQLALDLIKDQDLSEDEPRRLAFGEAVVTGFIHSGDYQGAFDFISNLQSAETPLSFEDRHIFYTQLSEAWLHFGSEDALAFLDSATGSNPQIGDELRSDFLQSWTLKNPSEALDYALEMPASQDREDIFQDGLSQWAGEDLTAASQWMNEHGQGAEFDEIVYQFSGSLPVDTDTIEESLEWAQSIHDPGLRQKGMAELLNTWLREEPEQARSFLQQDTSLPAEVIELALELHQSENEPERETPIPD